MTDRKRQANFGGAHPLMQRLRAIRKHRRVSLTRASQTSGYNRATISAWEGGYMSPTLQALTDYAQTLGMQLSLVPAETKEPAE